MWCFICSYQDYRHFGGYDVDGQPACPTLFEIPPLYMYFQAIVYGQGRDPSVWESTETYANVVKTSVLILRRLITTPFLW